MKNKDTNSEWIKEIKAIGWDLDGTLYPPDVISWKLVREKQIDKIMQANDWSREKSIEEFEREIKTLGSSTKTMNKLGADGPGFFRELWEELPLEEFIKRDEELIGMFDMLKDYRHFIVSNSNKISHITKKLDLIGLEREIFEVIISTDELGIVKPDPTPFLRALELMNENSMLGSEIMPGEVLYVGDRVETDIVGAKNVGMRTCLVGKKSDKADICIKKTTDLEPTILEK